MQLIKVRNWILLNILDDLLILTKIVFTNSWLYKLFFFVALLLNYRTDKDLRNLQTLFYSLYIMLPCLSLCKQLRVCQFVWSWNICMCRKYILELDRNVCCKVEIWKKFRTLSTTVYFKIQYVVFFFDLLIFIVFFICQFFKNLKHFTH